MIYKPFQDMRLPALGFGFLRLPLIDGDNARPDETETAKMVAKAMEAGCNYFDTAWYYHGGNSQYVLGRVMKQYPRDSFYIATKFPGQNPRNLEKVDKIFDKQLEECQVDFFDFYLYHGVKDTNIDAYLAPKFHLHDSLVARKKAGQIKHLGFSAHSSLEAMKRFLDARGEDMEFCQIQLNWLDWQFQDAKAKVELLNQWNIPIWVMEPLRGGRLARLSDEYAARLKELRPDEGIPAWGFRFIQSIPSVVVTLSGMSTIEQLEDNLNTFREEKPLSAEEQKALQGIADSMISQIRVPCTACLYCVDSCPQRLQIPRLLEVYDKYVLSDNISIAANRMARLPAEKRPSACAGCRRCEAVCPQQIKISEVMANFSSRLGL